jgi:hypothetical protein
MNQPQLPHVCIFRANYTFSPRTCIACEDLVLQFAKRDNLVQELALNVIFVALVILQINPWKKCFFFYVLPQRLAEWLKGFLFTLLVLEPIGGGRRRGRAGWRATGRASDGRARWCGRRP